MRRTGLLLATALILLPACAEAQFQRRNREPQIPPPSITEYKPRSTLVVPENMVPRAKFPVVDFHGHPPTLDNAETIEQVIAAMDELNLQVMVQARGSQGERLARAMAWSSNPTLLAAANHLPSSPGIEATRSCRMVSWSFEG